MKNIDGYQGKLNLYGAAFVVLPLIGCGMATGGSSDSGGGGGGGSVPAGGVNMASSGRAEAGAAGAMGIEEPFPASVSLGCTGDSLPPLPAADTPTFRRWLSLEPSEPIWRGVVADQSLLLLSSTDLTRVDLANGQLCSLAGFPDDWRHHDIKSIAGGRLVLATGPAGMPSAIYSSDDQGTTWARSAVPDAPIEFASPTRLAVHSTSGVVYAADLSGGLAFSADDGTAWTKVVPSRNEGSRRGGFDVDRSGAIAALAISGIIGCTFSVTSLPSSGAWRQLDLDLQFPCNGVVADPSADRAFYLFGFGPVSHITLDQQGSPVLEDRFGDPLTGVNDLQVDALDPRHVWFTGVESDTLSIYESLDFGAAAQRRSVEGDPYLIGTTMVQLPNGSGLSLWSTVPSLRKLVTAFVLGVE